jgi:hypothetical protein
MPRSFLEHPCRPDVWRRPGHFNTAKGVVSVAILALALALAVIAPADASVQSSREDPTFRAFKAERIAEKLGISVPEALRRVELQDRVSGVVDEIERSLGPDYGGLWFDHGDGGRLKIGIPLGTDESKVRTAEDLLTDVHARADADLIGVARRWAELEEFQAKLNQRLRGLIKAARVTTALDPTRGNAVIVETARSVTSAEESVVSNAARELNAPVRIARSPRDSLSVAPGDCGANGNLFYCSNPLRGGPNIYTTDSSPTSCSAGFMTRGNGPNNYPIVMSAGHCVRGETGTWRTRGHPNFNEHNIGSSWSSTFGPAGDWGIIRKTNDFWRTGHYIFVATSAETNRNDAYVINGSASNHVGDDVCVSSGIRMKNNYFTDCGVIQALGEPVSYGVDQLARATLCATFGSSGGPIFRYNKARGLLSGVRTDGVCESWFQGVNEALQASNVHLEP